MTQAAPHIAFLTLGCPKNEADSHTMQTALLSAGYAVDSDLDAADVVVVNTCSFIQEATEESIAAILEIAEEWVPAREGRKLVVAGCLPSRYEGELEGELAEVDAFVPVKGEDEIIRVIGDLVGVPEGAQPAAAESTVAPVGPSAYLKISDGCDRTCAYCAIPTIRGPYRSRSHEDVLADARTFIAGGARELVLIGQDTSIWGRDLEGRPTLASLIRDIAALDENVWVRVMYLQPEGLDDNLLRTVAEIPNVCNYFDIPLQHASKRVLRSMHRAGSGEQFLELVSHIRSMVPGAVIRTTLIAGFPGETEEEAQELLDFVEEAEFDYVGVFAYSQEEGTEAAEMEQVPLEVRNERAQALRDMADSIGFARAEARVGETHAVLFEEIDEDEEIPTIVGRWMGQAREIDGQVHCVLESPVTIEMLGDIVPLIFTDSFCYEMEGEIKA